MKLYKKPIIKVVQIEPMAILQTSDSENPSYINLRITDNDDESEGGSRH